MSVSGVLVSVGQLLAVLLTQKITERKRRGESSHPCLTAVVTGNGPVRVSPWMAWHVNLLYSFRMMVMISGRIPQFLRTSQSTWWSTLSNVSWKSTIVRNIIKHNCKKHFCTLVLIYLWILKCCILILGYQPESTFSLKDFDRHVGICGYSLSYSTNLNELCELDQGGSPSQKWCWLPVLLWSL